MGPSSILMICFFGLGDVPGKAAPRQNQFPSGGFKRSVEVVNGPDQRYDQVPFEGNIDAILRQLLLRAEEDNELAKLFESLHNQTKFKLDPEWLQGALKSQEQRNDLLEWARKQQGGGLSLESLKSLQEMLKRLQMESQRNPMASGQLPNPLGGGNVPIEPNIDDRVGRWAKDMLEELDDSGVGDFLRDSPAWQNALRDMERWVTASDGKFDWLGRVPEGLRLPDGWTPRLGDWTGRLPNLPELPRLRFNPPNLGGWNFNLGGGPRLSAPSLGGGMNISDSVLWVFVLVLFALLAWFFYQKLGRNDAKGNLRVARGPWPVDPAAVSTRTQLIQAFDYLALWLLGEEARSWNHVAVAQKLAAEASRNPAAGELAKLYELARYTPGADTLTPDAQAAARRHLLALAGSAA